MQIDAAYALFQTALMYVCVAALVALSVVTLFMKFAPVWERVWSDYLRLDGLGKVVAGVAVVMATLYGGSKGFIWNRVANDGADSTYTLVGIYTGTSNDVVVVEGVTTTNQIPLVAVATLNSAIPSGTDVSVRMSDTNQWTTLTKVNPRYEVYGTTNRLVFATAEDYSGFRYWWAGSDRPAVVITSTDIDITAFTATSAGVTIAWKCEQPLATTFTVQWKEATNSVWNTAVTTSQKTATVGGFWLDRTIDWRVISDYLEDGE